MRRETYAGPWLPEPLVEDEPVEDITLPLMLALAFYKSLFDEGLAPRVSMAQISNVWTEFGRGHFSLFLSGPWTIGDLKRRLAPALQDDWGTAVNPGPDGIGSAAPRSEEHPSELQSLMRNSYAVFC